MVSFVRSFWDDGKTHVMGSVTVQGQFVMVKVVASVTV